MSEDFSSHFRCPCACFAWVPRTRFWQVVTALAWNLSLWGERLLNLSASVAQRFSSTELVPKQAIVCPQRHRGTQFSEQRWLNRIGDGSKQWKKGPFSHQIPASLLLMVTERAMCTQSMGRDELTNNFTSICILRSSKCQGDFIITKLVLRKNIPPATSIFLPNCLNKSFGYKERIEFNWWTRNLSLGTFCSYFVLDENGTKQKFSK